MKACNVCQRMLALDQYHKSKAERDGHSHTCKACANARARANHLANAERRNAERTQRYLQNRDAELVKRKEWREANPERAKEIVRLWTDVNRERKHQLDAEYRKANPAKMQALSAIKRARKRSATPAWADAGAIAKVYDEAAFMRAIGLDVHVDHIYPLAGDTVCGLHVHQNLRVIFKEENLRKGNRITEQA